MAGSKIWIDVNLTLRTSSGLRSYFCPASGNLNSFVPVSSLWATHIYLGGDQSRGYK